MVYDINRESLANKGSSSFEFNIVAQKVSIQILLTHTQPMAHENDVNCVAFHPVNGLIMASCSDDGKVKIWKVELEASKNE